MKSMIWSMAATLVAATGLTVSAATTTGDGERMTRQLGDSNEIPLAPPKYRRPPNYAPKPYPKRLAELSREHSAEWRARAKKEMARIDSVIAAGPYKAEGASLDGHRCPEWFMDAKFGVLIDWSIAAVASWSPYRLKSAMYPDWYEKRAYMDWPTNSPFHGWYDYHKKNWGEDFRRDHFIDLFTAEKFDADALCRTFKECGARYCVPFVKHHSGYCHWDSSWTFRTTALRGPRRDFAAEYRRACDRHGLKMGFYFSLGEWEYPMLRDDGSIEMYMEEQRREPWTEEMEAVASGKVAVRDYLREYSIPQAAEFIDRYRPDILWYDYDWLQYADKIGSYEITAYFYNVNAGKKEVCVNDRYGWGRPADLAGRIPKGKKPSYKSQRCVRGDFYTDELGDNIRSLDPKSYHVWECNRGISCAYGNHWQDDDTTVLSRKGIVCVFADIVALGGNLGLIVNLDKDGDIPAIQRDRIETLGRWIRRWGEGIYTTRIVAPFSTPDVDYTRAKDGSRIFAIVKNPAPVVTLEGEAAQRPTVRVLGAATPLKAERRGAKLAVTVPDEFAAAEMPFVLELTK